MASRYHTKNLSSASFTVVESDQVTGVSVFAVSGTVTVNGNFPLRGVASEAVAVTASSGFTLTAQNPNDKIDGLTINASGGVAVVIFAFN
jgi:hypothetical protein